MYELLTIPETSELLRIGERTVYQMCREGRLPAAKVAGHWRIRRRDLEAWLDAGGELQRSGEAA